MACKVIVSLALKDLFKRRVKAVLDGHPEVAPGYGDTDTQAIGELVGHNPELFGIEMVSGIDEPMP